MSDRVTIVTIAYQNGITAFYEVHQGVNLRKADLREADLIDADLREAILIEADLRGAKLREADLRGARYNGETRFPAGFDPKTAGMIIFKSDDGEEEKEG